MPSRLRISLNTKFLPPDHRIYVMHPGADKVFYRDFKKQTKVFLELPGTEFPPQMEWDSDDAAARVRFGAENASWYRTIHRGVRPRRRLEGIGHAKRAVIFGQASMLYHVAKPGDLVVVPGSGYSSEVLIGELRDPPSGRQYFATTEIYGDAKIPARRVHWLRTDIIKARFSKSLIQNMQNRRAIVHASDENDKEEIYKHAYDNYTINTFGTSRVYVDRDAIGPLPLLKTNELLVKFSLLYAALERNEIEDFFQCSLEEAQDRYYDPELFVDTDVDIHSPGSYGLTTRVAALTLFVTIMIAWTGSAEIDYEMPETVVVENASPEGDNECEVKVAEHLETLMEHMNLDRWRKWCEETKYAQESAGLRTEMTATTENAND